MPFKIVYEIEKLKDYINKLVSSQLSTRSFPENIYLNITASRNAHHRHCWMLIVRSRLLALVGDLSRIEATIVGLYCGTRVAGCGLCVEIIFIRTISI